MMDAFYSFTHQPRGRKRPWLKFISSDSCSFTLQEDAVLIQVIIYIGWAWASLPGIVSTYTFQHERMGKARNSLGFTPLQEDALYYLHPVGELHQLYTSLLLRVGTGKGYYINRTGKANFQLQEGCSYTGKVEAGVSGRTFGFHDSSVKIVKL